MKTKLSLFSAFGVELEYMIVNKNDLSVSPISDQLIHDVAGQFQNEVSFEHIAWSNELVLHVIELKTNGPAASLQPLSLFFQNEVQKINTLLKKYDAILLPTGAHPWMNPFSEAKLWPHDDTIIYETYHKIFDCRGHGWSNLQSVHLNLPFANDSEFAKLHTAIRLVLPLIPSLCASSPIIDGKLTGLLDTRLEFYRFNQQRIPSVTGDIIPEVVFSEEEYNEKILNAMYQDISSYDPNKILQEEWLNSRGAIARFERNAIEIRLIDTQECPKADLAIINLIVVILKKLIQEQWIPFLEQTKWDSKYLQAILLDSIRNGMKTYVDKEFAAIFGFNSQTKQISLGHLWKYLLQELENDLEPETKIILDFIVQNGNLAERIVAALDQQSQLSDIYQNLALCLQQGKLFLDYENCNYM